MILIIGLGNPGQKFRGTRHNIGFSILNLFKKQNDFSNWQEKNKFQAKICTGKIGSHKVVLAKPQTFMNNSGQSVKTLIENYKLKIENLAVVHDDIDIAFGQIKISKNKSSAGHNGVQSIINELGSKDFTRFRIGIQPKKPITQDSADFVLGKFTKQEQKVLKEIKKRACDALEMEIKQGVKRIINRLN